MTDASLTPYPTTPFHIDRCSAHVLGIILNPQTPEDERQRARIQHLHLSATRAAQMKRLPLKSTFKSKK